MKRLLMLLILVLLVGCDASVDVVVEEPVVEQPDIEDVQLEIEEPEKPVEEEEPQVESPEIEEVRTYRIRYYYGYDDEIEDLIVEEGNVHVFSWPAREGYSFKGWFLDEALTKPIRRLSEVREDVDVYAKWEEVIKEPYEIVFDEVRDWFDFDFDEIHPIDYYVSPSSNQVKSDNIYNGMYQAAGLLQPYLIGFDNLSVTVVHPNDLEWYEDIVSTLDLFDYGDPWFERTSENGGGAVFESYSGRPHMFFMVPDRNTPSDVDIDWYVHETKHIFQLGLLEGKRDTNLGCMYTEGGATLIGNILGMVNEQSAWNHFIRNREQRIGQMADYYANETNLSKAIYDQVLFGQNDRCNVQAPGFGYSLGALVIEKMVYDIGIENFMDMHFYFNEYRIDEIFEMNFTMDYHEWVEQESVPYVIELIT